MHALSLLLLIIKLGLLPSLWWCHCLWCAGIFAIVAMAIVALVTMALSPLLMHRRLCCCWTSVVALVACCRSGIVALIMMALSPSKQRRLCCGRNCDCCPHDNGIIAIVDAQASLLSSRWRCCPCNNGIVTLDSQWLCCPVAMASLPSSSWRCCPCCNGVVVIINVVALVACCQAGIFAIDAQASLPSTCRCLHCCRDVALVTMASLPLSMRRHLHRCWANVVTLVACCWAGVVVLVAITLLPSMCRGLCHFCNCNCCRHDNCSVAIVDAQASVLSSRWCHCPHNYGIVALGSQ
jgi:hypothetical protein